jgi:hypothetical protein
MTPKPAGRALAWILRRQGYQGITLPPLGVYVVSEALDKPDLIRHEQAHWAQYERMGLIGYYARYLWYTVRYGYWNNPMEVEAREAQRG